MPKTYLFEELRNDVLFTLPEDPEVVYQKTPTEQESPPQNAWNVSAKEGAYIDANAKVIIVKMPG